MSRPIVDSFNSSNLEELVSIFTPVTSLKTNITYRNMYCLECSGENISDNAYIFWTAFFTCQDIWSPGVTINPIQNDNPYELFDIIFKTDTNRECNINLRASKIIEHLTPKKGSLSDFETCPLGSDKRLDLLCRHINLPVKQYGTSRDINLYRNIACYLCNKKKSFVEQCDTPGDKWVYEIGLNLIPKPGHFSAYRKVDTERSKNSSKSIIESVASSSYRPENNIRGQGIETFSKLEDMKKLASSYCNNKTEFKINAAQSQQLNIVLQNLIQNLDSIGSSFYSNYSFDVWSSLENIEPKIVVAIINITSTDSDYISTLNRIYLFLQNMTDLRFQTEQGMVDIGIKLCKENSYQFVGIETIYPSIIRRIIIEVYRRGTQLAKPLNEMEIQQLMGCYRIEVESHDRHYFSDSNFDFDVRSIRYENSPTFYKFSFCLADALSQSFNTTDTYMFKGFAGKTLIPEIQDQETIFSYNNVTPKIRKPEDAIFIKNNLSKNDTDTYERIEDPSLFSFGIRKSSLIVVAAVTLAVIVCSIVMYKKRVSGNSNVERDNIEMENGLKV